MIAHPPCTYISNMSNCRINRPGRKDLRELGMEFFLRFTTTAIPKVAIENPRGLAERSYRLHGPDYPAIPFWSSAKQGYLSVA